MRRWAQSLNAVSRSEYIKEYQRVIGEGLTVVSRSFAGSSYSQVRDYPPALVLDALLWVDENPDSKAGGRFSFIRFRRF